MSYIDKIATFILTIIISTFLVSFVNANEASLFVNNVELNNLQEAPTFYENHLLVPSREVFLPLGAKIEYNDKEKIVYIFYNDKLIVVQNEKTTAHINNEAVEMTVTAKIINNKLLIPLRSVSENLGLDVYWDSKTNSAFVTEKNVLKGSGLEGQNVIGNVENNLLETTVVPSGVSIIDIVSPEKDNEILIGADGEIGNYKTFVTDELKLVLDIYDVRLALPYSIKEFENNKHISAIRVALHNEDGINKTRIVFDLKSNDLRPNFTLSDDKTIIHVDFDVLAEELPTTVEQNNNYYFDSKSRVFTIAKTNPDIKADGYKIFDDYTNNKTTFVFPSDFGFGEDKYVSNNELIKYFEFSEVEGYTYLSIYWNQTLDAVITEDENKIFIKMNIPSESSEKVVIIDPGHGGHDKGASRADKIEKDIVFEISTKLYSKIKSEGKIKAYLTRTDDVYVEKMDRVKFGDKLGDVFISIHTNAFTTGVPKGIETYYYDRKDNSELNKNSKKLAEIVQKNLIEFTGATNRGVKSEEYVVVKYNTIPSILIETGFISNEKEGKLLLTDKYQNALVDAIYKSLLEYFGISS